MQIAARLRLILSYWAGLDPLYDAGMSDVVETADALERRRREFRPPAAGPRPRPPVFRLVMAETA
jgi:hypothetical protein